MAGGNWDAERARQETARLTAPGVLGFSTHFEATEIFTGQTPPVNVFPILVAEERSPVQIEEPVLLNPDRTGYQ
jgi:hypothetical protein